MSEKQTIVIDRPSYNITTGSFARIKNVNPTTGHAAYDSWGFCRDSFHSTPTLSHLMMWHGTGASYIEEFVHEFEKKLGHEKLSKFENVKFDSSESLAKTVTAVIPASFWAKNSMRRALFTILLRAGMKYNPEKKNFDACLEKSDYLINTKSALDRFMQGYTWYTGNAVGWVQQFSFITPKNVKKFLTLKPVTDKEIMDYACKKLNTTKNDLIVEYRKFRSEENQKKAKEKAEKKEENKKISTPIETEKEVKIKEKVKTKKN